MIDVYCEVWKAGPSEKGDVLIALIDKGGAFGVRWFVALEAVKREMLAVALGAMASGFSAHATIESAEEYSKIVRLYASRG